MGRQGKNRPVGKIRGAIRLGADESGQGLTELALVLPVLLLLILGMVDFGKAVNYWIDETHLSNEGARFAAVNSNPGSGAGQTLQQYLLGLLTQVYVVCTHRAKSPHRDPYIFFCTSRAES